MKEQNKPTVYFAGEKEKVNYELKSLHYKNLKSLCIQTENSKTTLTDIKEAIIIVFESDSYVK